MEVQDRVPNSVVASACPIYHLLVSSQLDSPLMSASRGWLGEAQDTLGSFGLLVRFFRILRFPP